MEKKWHRQLLSLALLLGPGIALVGCSDDQDETIPLDGSVDARDASPVDSSTTTGQRDASVRDGQAPADAGAPTDASRPCCTEELCSASGQTCNAVSCECESAPCSEIGSPCDLLAPPVPGFVCVPGDEGGVCRASCGPGEECPAGTYCAPGGYCEVAQCEGFFSGGCPENEKCFPADPVSHICIASGTATEGEPCRRQSDCAMQHVCDASGVCIKADCAPLTQTATCADPNAQCQGWVFGDGQPMDIGYCWIECEPFSSPTGCPEGEWCLPEERDPVSAQIKGSCVTGSEGTALAGEACVTSDECTDGLLCGDNDTCQAMCDKLAGSGAPGACAGETCLPNRGINRRDELVEDDWGLCVEPCIPWVSSSTETGCAPGEWCEPDFFDPALGQCISGAGTAAEGEACGAAPLPECQPGSFCSSDGECLLYCAPEATGGAPGATCSATQFCFGSTYTDGGLPAVAAAGYCIGSCDFDAGLDCSDPAEACVPVEILDATRDLCVEIPQLGIGDDCAPSGLDAGYLCGGLSVCLDVSPIGGPSGLTCQPLCRASAGTVGSFSSPNSNHPDCPPSQPACVAVFQGTTDFGLCIAP